MIDFGFTGALRELVSKNSPLRPEWMRHCLAFWWKRAVLVFSGSCFALLLSSFPAKAFDPPSASGGALFGGPILKIIYSAETKGEVYPCFY